MSKERSFKLFEPRRKGNEWRMELAGPMSEAVRAGGYVVSFISPAALRSDLVNWELSETAKFSTRIMLALLEPVADYQLRGRFHWLDGVRTVELFRGDNPKKLDWNRIDDLIVQIYHMVYVNDGLSQASQ
jgi:hypothetical protein